MIDFIKNLSTNQQRVLLIVALAVAVPVFSDPPTPKAERTYQKWETEAGRAEIRYKTQKIREANIKKYGKSY